MKTIATLLILFCGITFSNAQVKKELTKEQTVKYINDLFKQSYVFTDENSNKWRIDSVTLEGKILIINAINDKGKTSVTRRHLMKDDLPLKVIMHEYNLVGVGQYKIECNNKYTILFFIEEEEDAKRLKNALEHLIKLLKAEPETDPFAE